MFADAKGYLITEMVWEDVSDDDDEATHSIEKADPKGLSGGEKRPAASDISNTDEGEREDDKKVKGGAKGSQVAAKKVKKSAAPVVQQKGMMSFFGKK